MPPRSSDHVSGGGLSARNPPAGRDVADLQARFRWLVQLPLRSGLIRFLHSRFGQTFGVEAFGQ